MSDIQAAMAQYIADGLRSRVASPAIRAARKDRNAFCEYAFSDTATGEPIIQAEHHRLWQTTTMENDRVIMWYPIEHGKTTQTKMTWCDLLGRHPDRQYAHISSKADQAMKMVGSVKREIESNLKLHEVYPNLKPMLSGVGRARETWGNEAIRVQGAPPGANDPSLAAYGLEGKILGSRLHGAVIDNGLDSANTYTENMRGKMLDKIKDEIIGRIHKGGFLWILDTAWYHDDYMHELAKLAAWHSVKLDALMPLRDGDESLWPAQFPKERLSQRLAELGQTAFDRQFRNMPLSETMNFFKAEYWHSAYGRVIWCETLQEPVEGIDRQCTLRTGVDLATGKDAHLDLTAFSTLISKGHKRRLINLQSGRMEITEILKRVVSIYRTLHRPVNLAGGDAKFVVEDNAAQKYVVDLIKSASNMKALGLTNDEASDIRVTGRTTTKKKRDEEHGVQMLVSGLEMGRYDIAAHTETAQLREEMRTWYPGQQHYGDRLMSLWFAAADMKETGGNSEMIFI